MYLKDIFLKDTTHISICKRNPQTKCGFHLQFADYTYHLRIPLTVAGSATAQFNDANVLSFVCGFHKLFWIPQIQLRIPQFCLFFERFWALQQHRRSKKSSNVADSATNLILACSLFRLQCRESTVWPHNVNRPNNMPRFSSELHLGRIKCYTRYTRVNEPKSARLAIFNRHSFTKKWQMKYLFKCELRTSRRMLNDIFRNYSDQRNLNFVFNPGPSPETRLRSLLSTLDNIQVELKATGVMLTEVRDTWSRFNTSAEDLKGYMKQCLDILKATRPQLENSASESSVSAVSQLFFSIFQLYVSSFLKKYLQKETKKIWNIFIETKLDSTLRKSL